MQPYAELLEFNQPNPIRRNGFTRIRDSFPDLNSNKAVPPFRFPDPERIAEFAGRWDYGSKNAAKLGQTSKISVVHKGRSVGFSTDMIKPPEQIEVPIIQKWLSSGEQSMLEMGHATFFVECSRVVSHELVRHRLLSFQQESQRYTKYDEPDADLFYLPPDLNDEDLVVWDEHEVLDYGDEESGPITASYETNPGISAQEAYEMTVDSLRSFYKELREKGVSPQIARYVLPNAMRTRMVISGNVREWRHVIKLRLHSSAQPEMRELMQQIYDQLKEVFPQSLEGVLDEGRGIR